MTFDTPGPISVTFHVAAGDIRITAGDRSDTVVEVAPSDPSSRADVKAAAETRVDFARGRLTITTPRQRGFSLGKGWSLDIAIALPAGSDVDGRTGAGDIHSDGELGECRLKTGAGAIRLGPTGPLHVVSGAGTITAARAGGDVELTTGSGTVQLGDIGGTAVVKNSNGVTTVGEVAGDLRVSSSNGDINVARALASVVAKTANGNIRVGELVRGTVALETAFGEVELGIAEGTAAWLDARTHFGAVRNDLDAAGEPADRSQSVDVRARTAYGDIVVRRAVPTS